MGFLTDILVVPDIRVIGPRGIAPTAAALAEAFAGTAIEPGRGQRRAVTAETNFAIRGNLREIHRAYARSHRAASRRFWNKRRRGAGEEAMANVPGTNNADTLFMTSGVDVVTALGGKDKIVGAGYLTAADKIDGGGDVDTLTLDGDQLQQVIMTATTLVNVEKIEVQTGHDYWLKTHDATVANNGALTVGFAGDAALGGRIKFDGSAETNGSFVLTGAAGNDALFGGAKDDLINVGPSGIDTARGYGGDDVITYGAGLTAADAIDGGEGIDLVMIDGDYAQPLVFAATTLKNVEFLHIASGHDYSFKMNDGNVAAGERLHISMQGGSNGKVDFDGSAEKDGGFIVSGASGEDVMRGGAKNDSFRLGDGGVDAAFGGAGDDFVTMGGALTAADMIDGGAGVDDVLSLDGSYTEQLLLGVKTVRNVERIEILKTDDGVTNIKTHDATVAAGSVLEVNGAGGAGQALLFDGSSETDGHFDLNGAYGNDVLRGGAKGDIITINWGGDDDVYAGGGDDEIEAHTGFDPLDYIDGGAGVDRLTLGHFTNGQTTLSGASIKNIEVIAFDGDGSTESVTTTDSLVTAGKQLHVQGGYLDAAAKLTFDGSAEQDGSFAIGDHAGSDTFYGGQQADDIDLRYGGTDKVVAGDGKDLIRAFDKLDFTDSFDGGAGEDSLSLDGDYSISLAANTVRNIELLSLEGGHDYKLYLHDSTIGAGQTLTVAGYYLNADDTLLIGDALGTSGSLDVRAAATFKNSGSAVRGGAGDDSVNLDGDYSAGLVFNALKLTGVEHLTLGSGHSYNLTSHDNTVAAGKTMEVRGYWLGAGDQLKFNGSAELDGSFEISDGGGNDILIGGAGADEIRLSLGTDTAKGGGGDDDIDANLGLTAADRVDGGAGHDKLSLWSATDITLGGATATDIEEIYVESGHDFSFVVKDGLLDAGETLTVNGYYLESGDTLFINGALETNGKFDVQGGSGADTIHGSHQDDALASNGGADLLSGREGADTLNGGAGADTLNGGAGFDTLLGGEGNDVLIGDLGDDNLSGGLGTDVINGGEGNDRLAGGTGLDKLTGGAGSDVFIFQSIADSTVPASARDQIMDFGATSGDMIDVSGIDAILSGGDDAFTFTTAFHNVAGELRVTASASGSTFAVQGDVNGDSIADFAIFVTSDGALTANDFLL
jgi:Ca2+-binding RTX toxin-like protein